MFLLDGCHVLSHDHPDNAADELFEAERVFGHTSTDADEGMWRLRVASATYCSGFSHPTRSTARTGGDIARF